MSDRQNDATPAVSLADIRRSLGCSLLSDVLDGFGYMRQAMPARIRPLDEDLTMVGRARTALFADVYEPPRDGENPYALEIALIDSLEPDEIPVFSCGGTGRIAPWGGLLSTASRQRGAAGALMDGLVRDIREIRALRFPVFHAGIGPLDSKGRGKVVALDVRIECAGVPVASGDLIVGDADGCVVIPKAFEREVVAAALVKARSEHRTMEALRAGRSLADTFGEFGVL
jgi:4-hydroxy-4-methyl-2-oxoglutarate aldolase